MMGEEKLLEGHGAHFWVIRHFVKVGGEDAIHTRYRVKKRMTGPYILASS